MAASGSGWRALRHREFRLLCGLRVCTGLAAQMQVIALSWIVWSLTRDPLMLGLSGLAAFLPALLFALPAGHLADRYDRRAVVLVAGIALAAGAVAMFGWALAGFASVPLLFAAIAGFASVHALADPSYAAMVPNLVPRGELAGSLALASALNQGAVIGGPALGGLLYALGPAFVFAVILALLLIAAVLAALLRPQPRPVVQGAARAADVLGGLRFIRGRPVVLGAICLDLFAVLLGGATALLPIFADEILHVGPVGLGVLRAAPAAGAAAMGIFLAHRPVDRHAGRVLLGTVAAFGLFTIGFGLSASLWLSLLCLTGLGAADMISMAIRSVLIAADTPDAMRGRVLAVESVFIGASNELGEFESGVLAALVGAAPAVVLGGIGTVLVAALFWRAFPALRDRDRLVETLRG